MPGKPLLQDLVRLFCIDSRYKDNMVYVENIDSFCLYDRDTNYYKILKEKEMERIVFFYLLDNWDKSLSPKQIKDALGILKYYIPNRSYDVNTDYIALKDKKVWNLETFEYEDANFTKKAFYGLDCSSAQIEEATKNPDPQWMNFLKEIIVKEDGTTTDNELIDLLQEMTGYYLLNTLKAHAAFFLVGSGGNGKSVFLDLLRDIVGRSFSTAMSIETLTTRHFATSDLIGKKINICLEEESTYIKADKFKSLVSGDDMMVERKYGSTFTWRPTVKYIFATNKIPTFSNVNHGLTRRIYIIPFNRRFTDENKDTSITDKLRVCLPTILAWAKVGAKRIKDNDFIFSKPEQLKKKNKEFQQNISSAIMFVNENYEKNEDAFIPNDFIYDHYKEWCDKRGKKRQNFYNFFNDISIMLDLKDEEEHESAISSKIVLGKRLKAKGNIYSIEGEKFDF